MTYSYLHQHTFHPAPANDRRARFFTRTLFIVAVLIAIAAPRAAAITDAEGLSRFGSNGSGAGQLDLPGGGATDLTTGHVYVSDLANNRISEFTPWGNFVKAFGWDVATGAVNEEQEVRIRAATGQFKLTFGVNSTGDLPFDATAAEVAAALDVLPSIGGIGASASVSAVLGATGGVSPNIYVVAFKGSLAGTDVAPLTAANGTTPLGGGVPSTGVEVRTRADGTVGGTGLESCTMESGCKAGLRGAGAGELNGEKGIAVDSGGNVYVRELTANGGNGRVQKFDSTGRFLLMFGGEVNKTKSAEVGTTEAERNLCTNGDLEGGGECGAGVPGTGQGQFANGFADGIAIGTSGKLFVADKGRIQRFDPEGEFEISIPVPAAENETVKQLAFDPLNTGLYIYFEGEAKVHKLDSTTGAEVDTIEGSGEPIATDATGHLFAGTSGGVDQGNFVSEFDSSGAQISSCCEAERLPPPATAFFPLRALATNAAGALYVAYAVSEVDSFIRLFGRGPVSFEAAPRVAPTITAQFASSVERDGAAVAADINPHFWGDTRYYVEYGTGKCSEGGCGTSKPVPPGAPLGTKAVDAPLKSPAIFLEGLQPATTYHYRFVAQSSGGGPVRGIGGEVGVEGGESTFTTYPAATQAKGDCPNQVFRVGFSAPLPDCRAFEMVSPVDKNGGDISTLSDSIGYDTALDRSSTDGERFTYSSAQSFADPKAAPYTVQYMAERHDGVGWGSRAIVPAQGPAANAEVPGDFENLYKAFSADLCSGWLVSAAEPLLAPGATAGYSELYRRDDCSAETYELVSGGLPTSQIRDFNPELLGASADDEKAIFRVKDKLTEDATGGVWQAYYASKGQLRLVCILPSGLPSAANCSGGTGVPAAKEQLRLVYLNRLASVRNAISSDGSRVYWTASGADDSGPGQLYLRLNPGQEQSAISSGECTEAERACTLRVSETVSTKAAYFLGASTDGSKALFEIIEGTQAGNLYEFDLATEASTLIAKKVGRLRGLGFFPGLVGAGEDLSHVYFVSEEALPGTSGATAGRPNLYLDQEGGKTFVATLAEGDFESNASPEPIRHAARVSLDGRRIAFSSTERLTGYDNTDQGSGRADAEIYHYEAGTAGPVCVSCNPSGARPQGRALAIPTAASIPPAQNQFSVSRALSEDGGRLFFDSYDALLLRDTNGKEDVYEWEAASGEEECRAKGAELYVPSSAGCLSLISSGESPSDSEFLDATPSGNDAFFTTSASLLPQDTGLVDAYDARVNGGLPTPSGPPGPCQGEGCQGPTTPPDDPTPASASFRGAGNLKPTPRCRKGKVARKGRCVARKQKRVKERHRRGANHNRRHSR